MMLMGGSEGFTTATARTEPQRRWRCCSAAAALLLLTAFLLQQTTVDSFQSVTALPPRQHHALLRTTGAANIITPSSPSSLPTLRTSRLPPRREDAASTSTSLNNFMGSDGGLLGVGGPEIFTILLVGYFVLGPSELYKLVKEIGKFIQNIRTLGTDLSTTFENNMESSLQLEELRKAQRELNDAFSFRRSINVDADGEAFSVQAGSAQEAAAAAAAATASATVLAASPSAGDASARPKKIRRRVRKQQAAREEGTADLAAATTPGMMNNVPDLEMPESALEMPESAFESKKSQGISEKEAAEIEAEFDQYVLDPPSPPPTAFSGLDDWYGTQKAAKAAAAEPGVDQGAQSRFQQQLSGNWNDQILAVSDKLEPMALVMNKIALLEQEKAAAIRRLEEEFAKRTELEETYYQEQRKLLEEAASEVQSAAFGVDSKTKI